MIGYGYLSAYNDVTKYDSQDVATVPQVIDLVHIPVNCGSPARLFANDTTCGHHLDAGGSGRQLAVNSSGIHVLVD
jgi:hypothetical protein